MIDKIVDWLKLPTNDMSGTIGYSILGGCIIGMILIGAILGAIGWSIHHWLHWF